MAKQFYETKLKLETTFNEDRKKNFFRLKIKMNRGGMADVGVVLIEDIPGKESDQFRMLTRQLTCYLNDTIVWTSSTMRYEIVSLQVPSNGKDYTDLLSMILKTGDDVIRCSPQMVYIIEQKNMRAAVQTLAPQQVRDLTPAEFDPERPARKGMGLWVPAAEGPMAAPSTKNRFDSLNDDSSEPIQLFLPVTCGVDARRLVATRIPSVMKPQRPPRPQQLKKRPQQDAEEEEEQEEEEPQERKRKTPLPASVARRATQYREEEDNNGDEEMDQS